MVVHKLGSCLLGNMGVQKWFFGTSENMESRVYVYIYVLIYDTIGKTKDLYC